jgi:putative DNA primase/helicase
MKAFEDLLKQFNKKIQGKRLIVVNETSSTKEKFMSGFDKMKSFITDDIINIEPKGRESYDIDNILNFIIETNHKDSLYLESSDRRYFCMEVSDKFIQNMDYFENLRKKSFNDECVNNFYTYMLNYDESKLVEIRKPPLNELKKEIINISKSSSLRFLDYIKDSCEEVSENKIQAAEFYAMYKNWCQENNEHAVTNTKFGLLIKNKITKDGRKYVITTIIN